MLDFIDISLGRGGRVSCVRCARAEGADYRQSFDVSAEVEAACAAWGAGPGPNVALGGAEPFGHPDLPPLLSSAVKAGVKRLRVDTDGVALAMPENASSAIAAGVRHVRVTLLGGSPDIHDALAGAPGGLERARRGMRESAAAAERAGVRVSLSAHVPVCRHNCHELPNTIVAAAEAGARHALVEVTDPALDVPAAMPWIGAACDSGTVNCLWVELAGVPYCFAGQYALHLAPVFRTVVAGEKTDACGRCALDEACGGLPAGATPQVKAALAPPAAERLLAESIRRAYLAPGPGEVE